MKIYLDDKEITLEQLKEALDNAGISVIELTEITKDKWYFEQNKYGIYY